MKNTHNIESVERRQQGSRENNEIGITSITFARKNDNDNELLLNGWSLKVHRKESLYRAV